VSDEDKVTAHRLDDPDHELEMLISSKLEDTSVWVGGLRPDASVSERAAGSVS
jgi:hypothetical protein